MVRSLSAVCSSDRKTGVNCRELSPYFLIFSRYFPGVFLSNRHSQMKFFSVCCCIEGRQYFSNRRNLPSSQLSVLVELCPLSSFHNFKLKKVIANCLMCAIYRVLLVSSILYASITSPSLMSLKFSIPRPQSYPARTSFVSSFPLLREASNPV